MLKKGLENDDVLWAPLTEGKGRKEKNFNYNLKPEVQILESKKNYKILY